VPVATTRAPTAIRVVPAWPFVAAIGLSAFALFCLELLSGQLVLPVFGGAPAVWASALCFFTAVLFAGYLYAHLLIARLALRTGIAAHLAVASCAVAATLAAPSRVADVPGAGVPDAPNVLLALLVIAGPPAFLFSATTPLLSAWFARGRSAAGAHVSGRDAFWLYAASNGSSLIAVLGYPFVLQPFLGLSLQRSLIAVAAVVFTALVASVGVRLWRAGIGSEAPAVVTRAEPAPALTVRRQVRWLAAAAVPAGLLSATTTYITTDLTSAPFMWVWPLALYLLSFVVAFSDAGRRLLPRLERLVPAAATLLWVPSLVFGSWPVVPLLLVVLTSYGVLACAIHGRLAADRPDERHLTRFYLVLSAGGVLATAFVAIVAPSVFEDVAEYPLLIVAGLAVLAWFRSPLDASAFATTPAPRPIVIAAARRLAPYHALGTLFTFLVLAMTSQLPLMVTFLVAGAAVIALATSYRILAVLTASTIVLAMAFSATTVFFQERTFFGVLKVVPAADGASIVEYSGTTLHGVQFLDQRRTIPTSYYVRGGPLGDVFADLGLRAPSASIGVVGLGTGTIAAYERPSDTMTFYEIDPAVERLARDPRWFSYLADAPDPPTVVLGDARRSLEAAPTGAYDVLVLDAFSSDNVPTHLLTREALATYRRVMKPGGIIVFHVSNRSYDLAPGIVSTAASLGLAGRQLAYEPGPTRVANESADGSDWVVVGDFADLDRFSQRGWGIPRPGPVLTDDFSDLLRMLRIFG
jgi:hypothetical protein